MFKVMTWNVENLFRVGQPSGPTTPAAYDNKLKDWPQRSTNRHPTR